MAQQPSSKKKHVFMIGASLLAANKESHKPYLIVIDMIHTVDTMPVSLQCS